MIRLGIDQLPTREGEGYHLLPSRHMKPAACVPPELLLMQRQGGVTHSEASTICPILHAQTLSLLASVAVIDGEESMASFALFGRGWLWHLWDSYLRSMDDQANTFFFFFFPSHIVPLLIRKIRHCQIFSFGGLCSQCHYITHHWVF